MSRLHNAARRPGVPRWLFWRLVGGPLHRLVAQPCCNVLRFSVGSDCHVHLSEDLQLVNRSA